MVYIWLVCVRRLFTGSWNSTLDSLSLGYAMLCKFTVIVFIFSIAYWNFCIKLSSSQETVEFQNNNNNKENKKTHTHRITVLNIQNTLTRTYKIWIFTWRKKQQHSHISFTSERNANDKNNIHATAKQKCWIKNRQENSAHRGDNNINSNNAKTNVKLNKKKTIKIYKREKTEIGTSLYTFIETYKFDEIECVC